MGQGTVLGMAEKKKKKSSFPKFLALATGRPRTTKLRRHSGISFLTAATVEPHLLELFQTFLKSLPHTFQPLLGTILA